MPPEFKRDSEKLTAWAKSSRPEFLIVKEDVNWAGLKSVLKVTDSKVFDPETGEVVPGVEVIDRGITFRVKTV